MSHVFVQIRRPTKKDERVIHGVSEVIIVFCLAARFCSFVRTVLCSLARCKILTGNAVGSVSNLAREEHIVSLGVTVGRQKGVLCAGRGSNKNCSIQVAAHAGMDEDVVVALPPEGNCLSDGGHEFLGAVVGDDPAEDIDVVGAALGLGDGGQLGQDEEGEEGKVGFCHGFGVLLFWTLF